MDEVLTLYKLMILYFLYNVKDGLTFTIISDFMTDYGYAGFFNLSEANAELLEVGFVQKKEEYKRTYLYMTPEGEESFLMFESQIPSGVKKDIDDYLKDKRIELRDKNSIRSDYSAEADGRYKVSLSIRELGKKIFGLELYTMDEKHAATLCDGWENSNQDVFVEVMKLLNRSAEN